MVVASIDIQGGKVVQLKQGSQLVLQRNNAQELAEEFDRYGEVAVIDLDAAMGKGSNLAVIKPLLRRAECRVGGGIKTPEQAKELVSLGARKIIVGSPAFRDDAKKGSGPGEFGLNAAFLDALAKKIGRERIVIAVDARKSPGQHPRAPSGDYEITVDGWKTPTGLPLIETAAAAASYASELLFTCVDREGTMTGIDLEPVRRLREAADCRITAAGGVSTLEEVEALAALNCDVQLGMALYTGKISLADAFICSLNWKKLADAGASDAGASASDASASGVSGPGSVVPGGASGSGGTAASAETNSPALIPVIAQSPDGQVLMTGFADHEALAETFKRGMLCFHSRTRNRLWMKGEHSGNTLRLLRLRADCDRDALLAVVEPAGPVCHTGGWSCFGTNRRYTWEYLQSIIAGRLRNPAPDSYTATLDDGLVREKIMEEADELCAAKTRDEKIWEAADLLYFATVLLTREDVTVEEVLNELERRHLK
ncbi:MAG: phosphoribosyl-ATP diphosphatase [Spirochaetaceae bacterium]|jgi:phosphoribosyl-ATP pyrophosphohydrolase/phosphoribosyl-AMP cyclohydrolase|nr:phosphoribosyl-ATP diphosphatase [Spirochaetaceae bacterium]